MNVGLMVLGLIVQIPSTFIVAQNFDAIEFCPLYFLPLVDSNWYSFPSANAKDAITFPRVSYEVDAVFHPGQNIVELSVEQGAPCVAVCTVVSEKCDIVRMTRLPVFSSSQAHAITIHFKTPGLYRAVCRIKNKGGCLWCV